MQSKSEVSKFLPSPGSVFIERFTLWTTSAPSSEPGASVAMVTSLGKSDGESAAVFLALGNEIEQLERKVRASQGATGSWTSIWNQLFISADEESCWSCVWE